MAAMADHVFTPRRDSDITCFTCGRDESDPVHTLYFNQAQLAVIHMMTTGNYSADWWEGYAYAKAQAVTLLECRFPPKPVDRLLGLKGIDAFVDELHDNTYTPAGIRTVLQAFSAHIQRQVALVVPLGNADVSDEPRATDEQIHDFAQTIRELFTTLRDAPVWEKLDQELYEAWVEEMQGRAADMLERMPQKRD
jgi:hypothetical protein